MLGLETCAEIGHRSYIENGVAPVRWASIGDTGTAAFAQVFAGSFIRQCSERHGQLVCLSCEAHIGLTRETDLLARPSHHRRDTFRKRRVPALGLVERSIGGEVKKRDRLVHLEVGEQEPECAEHPRRHRQHHAPDLQHPGEVHRVDAPVSSERDQGEVSGITPAIGGHRLDRLHHVGVGHGVDAERGLHDIAPEGGREAACYRIARPLEPDGDAPPGERLRVEIAEDHVGVGDRRLVVAGVVARGARHRAGAPGAGPHSTIRAGICATASASRMPPLDWITIRRPPMPAPRTWETMERT